MSFASRGDKAAIESGDIFMPKFNDAGLIPVTTTCATTGTVLMQAWMNAEALALTIKTQEAYYWSRSRSELWHKGATSGQVQQVAALLTDCDQDSLVMKVNQLGGGCCHTGADNCFYREVELGDASGETHLKPAK